MRTGQILVFNRIKLLKQKGKFHKKKMQVACETATLCLHAPGPLIFAHCYDPEFRVRALPT